MSRLQTKLLSVGSLGTLIAVMATIDESFRAFLTGFARLEPAAVFAPAGMNVHHLVHTVTDLIPIQLSGQGPLVFFALTGGALFVLMFRT